MGTTTGNLLERELWRNVRAVMAVPDVTRAAVKGAIVNILLVIPSVRLQRLLAAVVRHLWPGFRQA